MPLLWVSKAPPDLLCTVFSLRLDQRPRQSWRPIAYPRSPPPS